MTEYANSLKSLLCNYEGEYLTLDIINKIMGELSTPQQPNDDKDLKPIPCPCGDSNPIIIMQDNGFYRVVCNWAGCWKGPQKPSKFTAILGWNTIATPQQPSEKKALSVEEIEKIIHKYGNVIDDCGVIYTSEVAYNIRKAIHSALPARKEVKWPEKKTSFKRQLHS